MMAAEIISALTTLRRRLRALLVIDGLSRWLAGMISAAAGLALLDWWVRFPWFIRVGFLIIGVAWTLTWGLRRVFRPLFHPVALDQLALSLKILDPDLRDRLAGVVALQRGGGDGSALLWESEMADAARRATITELAVGLNPRRTVRSGIAVVVTTSMLYVFIDANRPFAEIAWGRLATPTADVRWPRATRIMPLTGDAKIALGDAFTVEMRLDQGDDPDVRGFVHCRIGSRQAEDLMMRRDSDGVYRRVLENVTGDLRYWFRAGDDDTSDRPFQVTVVRRPGVVSARLLVTPPEYAGDSVERELLPRLNRWTVVRGGHVRMIVVGDKPLRMVGEGPGRVVFESGRSLSMRPSDNSRTLQADWTADTSGWLDLVLVDEDGFESRGGPRFELDVRRDEPPTVSIVEPAAASEILPSAVVMIRVKAQDDVGLRAIRLLAALPGRELSTIADLTNQWTQSTKTDEAAIFAHEWDLAPLALNPGDVVTTLGEVEDGFRLDGQSHPPTRSGLIRLQVVTERQFFDRFRQDLAELRLPIRRLLLTMETLKNALVDSQNTDAGQPLMETLSRLITDARRAVDGALQTVALTQRLIRRAESNRAPDNDLVRQARRIAGRLEETTEGPIRAVVERLTSANRPSDRHDILRLMRHSADAASAATQALRRILEEVERWESYDDLVRKLEELIDRQEALGRECARPERNDPAAVSADAARLAGEQSILRDETERLFAALREVGQRVREKQDAAGLALERAQREGARRGVLEHMAEAVESLRRVQWAPARGAQELAAAGLRAMQVALRDKIRRELEQLTRSARDLRQRLGQLLKAQESLIDDTTREIETDAGAEGLSRLADRQFTLEQTTRRVAVDPQLNAADAGRVNVELLEAARQMSSSADRLREGSGSASLESQQAAVEALRQAIALLERVEARAAEELAEQSFAAIVEALRQIAMAQRTLRDETDQAARRDGERRVSRVERLAFSRLARRQTSLRAEFNEVRGSFGGSVVYGFVAEAIAARMQSAADSLTGHQAAEAVEFQDAVLHDLELLIAAGKEPPLTPESRFVAEENSGGEGMNVPRPSSPIPSLAELRALRQLQIELNDKTRALHHRLPEASSRDALQRSQIDDLGRSQRRIHDLARQMVVKSGGGS